MATRWTPRSILSVFNAVANLNANFTDISGLLDRILFRDGTANNQMLSDVDMNSFKIKNLEPGVDPSDAVCVSQLTSGSLTLPAQANNTVLANVSGVSAVPTATSISALTSQLNNFTSTVKGVVPSSGGGTSNFLRADGTWATPAVNVGSVAWGAITGSIASQTDLTGALAAKAPLAAPSFTTSVTVSDGTSPTIYVNKTGTNAGSGIIYNDGNLNIKASPVANKSITLQGDSVNVYSQDGLTQYGKWDNGGNLTLSVATKSLFWTDANGGHPGLSVDGSNNLTLAGTDGTGAARTIWSVGMHSGSSTLNFAVTATGVTPPTADNTTKIATTAYVQGELVNKTPAFPTIGSFAADFTVADSYNNTFQKHTSATAHTITLNATPTAGCCVVIANRSTGVLTLSAASGLYKNGASSTSTTGSIAAGGVVSLFHEGAGIWSASGDGLT